MSSRYALLLAALLCSPIARGEEPLSPKLLPLDVNTWVKISPLKGGPTSPSLGYECAIGWDQVNKRLIRWGGHNQGGGGEQNSEIWTFDPLTRKWEWKQPNTSPPGVCCAQQNVFDTRNNQFIRFPAFSGSHGWHWFRENYLSNSTVWVYDLKTNTWRDRRPVPAPRVAPLRCASWDSHHHVAVVFGGEGSQEGTLVYDPSFNTWTKKKPKIEPEFRSGGNMVYDEAHNLHILFGSQFINDQHTWAYDLEKNEWRDLKPKTMPPTDRNDAVLAYDSVNKRVIAVVKVIDDEKDKEATKAHLETWAFDTGKNDWTRMKPAREPDGSGSRRRVMTFIPELNVTIMEAYVNPTERVPDVEREQQIWVYRHPEEKNPVVVKKRRIVSATVIISPKIVEDAVVSVIGPKEVKLSWTPPGADVVDYHVERAVVEVFSEDQVIRLKKDTKPLEEPSVGTIKLIGPFQRITKERVNETEYMDSTIELSKPITINGEATFTHRFRDDQLEPKGKAYRYAVYAYRIVAANSIGKDTFEGGPSAYCLTIPSAPQHVFSKEDGEKCHLKWKANPEKGIKGYRVYRMEGPKINGPGQPVTRLNDEPITETTFIDPNATKETKRYWIVAVDALGQEGIPSAPVWHYRQYQKFYEPFSGEWHQ